MSFPGVFPILQFYNALTLSWETTHLTSSSYMSFPCYGWAGFSPTGLRSVQDIANYGDRAIRLVAYLLHLIDTDSCSPKVR